MKQKLTRKDVTPELIQAGYAYIAAKAKAQTIAKAVEPVQVEVLAGFEFFDDLEVEHGAERECITDPDQLYLSEDEDGVTAYYVAVDKALKDAGLKPQDMPVENCPILVAKHAQTKAEWSLIVEAAKMLGVDNPDDFNNQLLCQPNGLEKRREFIELTATLVVNL